MNPRTLLVVGLGLVAVMVSQDDSESQSASTTSTQTDNTSQQVDMTEQAAQEQFEQVQNLLPGGL